jgi:hypothetical protein
MRIASRLLAILTIAVMLAPSARWAAMPGGGAACCAGAAMACDCPNHHGSMGSVPACCMGRGGQCGVESPDANLASLLSTLIFVPTEHHLSGELNVRAFDAAALRASLLPSHAAPPDQPPRTAL